MKRVVKRRRKARKPMKKPTGTMASVWSGKAMKTKKGLTKRSLMMKDGKVVAKSSAIGSRIQVFRGTEESIQTRKETCQQRHWKMVQMRYESTKGSWNHW